MCHQSCPMKKPPSTASGAAIENAVSSQMFGKKCYKIGGKAFVSFFQDAMVFQTNGSASHSDALALKRINTIRSIGQGSPDERMGPSRALNTKTDGRNWPTRPTITSLENSPFYRANIAIATAPTYSHAPSSRSGTPRGSAAVSSPAIKRTINPARLFPDRPCRNADGRQARLHLL